ncbi:MAG TPA: tripartite tricarboxylate transporter substrate-binding protein [Xanthobacteraceae bacterium]|nr:tripartite tricarboxylate transporter substrate-binding protein [Xanthobacteraceae bacterium]
MKRLMLVLAAALLTCTGAAAQAPDFTGKTITMIIGYAPGGGTDASGRLIASHLVKYLPGKPNLIVQNMPGADGITAMNHFFSEQVKPDGLTITMGSSTQGDPVVYRQPQAHYDPTKLNFIGGVGRGGSTVVINKDAEKRLYDKSKPPVIMGSVGGIPRSGMQTTAWGIDLLNWNAKWVTGYPGTNELFLALERGEIDMTASSNLFQVRKLLETGKVKVLTQTGTMENGKIVSRSEFKDVPAFPDMVEGKVKDPLKEKAYKYWFSLVVLDKWLALPPGTPQPIVQAYRDAFAKLSKDQEFLELGKKISQDFETQDGPGVANLIKTLGGTTPEAVAYINTMLKGQGLGN